MHQFMISGSFYLANVFCLVKQKLIIEMLLNRFMPFMSCWIGNLDNQTSISMSILCVYTSITKTSHTSIVNWFFILSLSRNTFFQLTLIPFSISSVLFCNLICCLCGFFVFSSWSVVIYFCRKSRVHATTRIVESFRFFTLDAAFDEKNELMSLYVCFLWVIWHRKYVQTKQEQFGI